MKVTNERNKTIFAKIWGKIDGKSMFGPTSKIMPGLTVHVRGPYLNQPDEPENAYIEFDGALICVNDGSPEVDQNVTYVHLKDDEAFFCYLAENFGMILFGTSDVAIERERQMEQDLEQEGCDA